MKDKEELPLFSETLGTSTSTTSKLPVAEIKFKISGALANDALSRRVTDQLSSPTRIGGSVQFDHSMAANEINDSLGLTTQYKTITMFKIWELLLCVLKKHGYRMTKGHMTGHVFLEHKTTPDATDVTTPDATDVTTPEAADVTITARDVTIPIPSHENEQPRI